MPVLLWGVNCVALAFVVHLIGWRVRLPRRHTRTLLILFLGIPAAFVLLAPLLPPPAAQSLHLPVGTAQYAQVLLFAAAMGLGYIISYSAVEADSPSLVIAGAIADAGPEGLAEAALFEMVSDDVLVKPRVADLLRDGHIRQAAGGFEITRKGRKFVRIFILARRILGAEKGG
jgi:hypothetical protein